MAFLRVFLNNMKKNYLPSKKFIYSIIALVIAGILFFIISGLISKKNHFTTSNDSQLQTENLTINDLLKKDSDGDGVADWEEALWGTDPNKKITFNGIPDADYIQKKRDELKLSGENNPEQNSATLSETDKFAQEFFASVSAMKQSGQIDANTINNVSASLGQKIVDPTMIDKYTDKDIKINENDGIKKQEAYYLNIKKLFETYSKKGIGDEVEIASILANSSATGDKSKYVDNLNQIADAYQEYAQKIMEIAVPQSLASYHIKIANSANNTGIAVRNMAKVADDPIVGLSGLSQYQKYSEELVSSVGDLETILYNNGIIIQ